MQERDWRCKEHGKLLNRTFCHVSCNLNVSFQLFTFKTVSFFLHYNFWCDQKYWKNYIHKYSFMCLDILLWIQSFYFEFSSIGNTRSQHVAWNSRGKKLKRSGNSWTEKGKSLRVTTKTSCTMDSTIPGHPVNLLWSKFKCKDWVEVTWLTSQSSRGQPETLECYQVVFIWVFNAESHNIGVWT